MIDKGIVYGSEEQAKSLIVSIDTVYVHTDIQKVDNSSDDQNAMSIKSDNLYSYYEIQYTKDEYIELISKDNTSLKNELLTTQLALTDIYELLNK